MVKSSPLYSAVAIATWSNLSHGSCLWSPLIHNLSFFVHPVIHSIRPYSFLTINHFPNWVPSIPPSILYLLTSFLPRQPFLVFISVFISVSNHLSLSSNSLPHPLKMLHIIPSPNLDLTAPVFQAPSPMTPIYLWNLSPRSSLSQSFLFSAHISLNLFCLFHLIHGVCSHIIFMWYHSQLWKFSPTTIITCPIHPVQNHPPPFHLLQNLLALPKIGLSIFQILPLFLHQPPHMY